MKQRPDWLTSGSLRAVIVLVIAAAAVFMRFCTPPMPTYDKAPGAASEPPKPAADYFRDERS